jgi:hypothetical protein
MVDLMLETRISADLILWFNRNRISPRTALSTMAYLSLLIAKDGGNLDQWEK